MTESLKTAFLIGWAAVKDNRIPAVVLWSFALTLVVGYYYVTGVARALAPFGRWQAEFGFLAAFANRVFFLGLVPGVFLLAVRSLRPNRVGAVIVAQSIYCGCCGVVTDAFYRFQTWLWGAGADLATLVAKTLVDQALFTVLFIAPANAVFFFWVSQGLSFREALANRPDRFFSGLVLPNLVMNWCVAIPVVFCIYALPVNLQLQVSGLTSAFWVLLCLRIGKRSQRLETEWARHG